MLHPFHPKNAGVIILEPAVHAVVLMQGLVVGGVVANAAREIKSAQDRHHCCDVMMAATGPRIAVPTFVPRTDIAGSVLKDVRMIASRGIMYASALSSHP